MKHEKCTPVLRDGARAEILVTDRADRREIGVIYSTRSAVSDPRRVRVFTLIESIIENLVKVDLNENLDI